MNKETKRAWDALVSHWEKSISILRRLNKSAQVRPNDPYQAFSNASVPGESFATFNLKPTVLRLPERGDDINTDLYVTVCGSLSLEAEHDTSELLTHKFGTHAAYFRQTAHGLDHVYGAHYDFAIDELGHPVFHSQMRSFDEMRSIVAEQYGVSAEGEDRVKGVLRTVRLPSAQMDIFSLFLQMCADHLLHKSLGSDSDERKAFDELLANAKFLRGAGARAARLAEGAGKVCYRAGHWYPRAVRSTTNAADTPAGRG